MLTLHIVCQSDMRMKKNNPNPDYLERDISWMYFNRRILQEACKSTVPLLERMSFLGIYSNNLDEFFRVRVASLNRIIEWDDKSAAKEAKNAEKIVKAISKLNSCYINDYEATVESVYKALADNGLHLISDTEADSGQSPSGFRPLNGWTMKAMKTYISPSRHAGPEKTRNSITRISPYLSKAGL